MTNPSLAPTGAPKLRRLRKLVRYGVDYFTSVPRTWASIATGKTFVRPVFVAIGITTHCNFRCAMCDIWRHQHEAKEELSSETIARIIDEMYHWGVTRLAISGGEPLMAREKTIETIARANQRGIFTSLVTNGWFLDDDVLAALSEAGLEHLAISIDGLEATHDSIRGVPGSFRRALRALEAAQAMPCKSFAVKVGTVVTRRNLADIPGLLQLAQDYDVPIEFTPVHLYVFGGKLPVNSPELISGSPLWVDSGALAELGTLIEKLKEVKRRTPLVVRDSIATIESWEPYFRDPQSQRRQCITGYKNIQIAPNGEVVPCWYFSKPVGNVKWQSLKEIWYSGEYERARKGMLRCQSPCVLGCHHYGSLWRTITNQVIPLLREMVRKPKLRERLLPSGKR